MLYASYCCYCVERLIHKYLDLLHTPPHIINAMCTRVCLCSYACLLYILCIRYIHMKEIEDIVHAVEYMSAHFVKLDKKKYKIKAERSLKRSICRTEFRHNYFTCPICLVWKTMSFQSVVIKCVNKSRAMMFDRPVHCCCYCCLSLYVEAVCS